MKMKYLSIILLVILQHSPVKVDRREGIARESIAISKGAMLLKIEDITSS